MSGPDVDALAARLEERVVAVGMWCASIEEPSAAVEASMYEAVEEVRSLAALARSAAEMEEALEGIERYAYDAICDGHPSIPEMTRVQQRAMGSLATARSREQQEGT